MGDLLEPNITLTEEERLVQSPTSDPSPSPIGAERWAIAEKSTQKIICQVQPTVVSEKRRIEVIDYVRRLIRNCNGCEVFPYGSVPLKTYLPDGDIDLTAFGGASIEEALANNIVYELQREEKSSCAEFVVKEIQLIHAEVKLVKCLVQNIVVDISFNQIGGLCTLCFLEQVDHFIGKDHLFKRSILLIKSWCYYESRILGAHHGLISTYALEILVLYIFQVFHSTLDGPLAVLYKFLDYFSKFDWENYCISLRGPVRVSSLPEIEVETPEKGLGDLLLSEDFYRYCVDTFSVPSKDDINIRIFPQKHLNIVDPLKEYNNLGRSVSKGNFYRIMSAFAYGARKLGQLLMRPEDSISTELCTFFWNTLDRHGSGQRPDVQGPVYRSSPSITCPAFSVSETESSRVEKVSSSSKAAHFIGIDGDYKHNPVGLLQDGGYVITELEEEMKLKTANGQQRDAINNLRFTVLPDANASAKGCDVLGFHFSGDAKDHAIPRIQALKISDDSQGISSVSREKTDSPKAKFHYAPHLHFSKPPSGSGETKYGNSNVIQSENHDNRLSSEVLQVPVKEKGVNIGNDLGSKVRRPARSQDFPSVPYPVALSEDSHYSNCGLTSASNAACHESSSSLLDLRGDFKFYLNCLQYGRWFYEYALYMPALSMPPPPPSHFQSMNSWDAIQRLSPQNGFSNGIINSVIQRPMFYTINPVILPGVSFGSEEMPKPRGTGTYFPNMNRPPHGYRPFVVKGRNQAPVRSPRSNGRAYTFNEFPVDQGGGMPGFLDAQHSGSPQWKVHPNVNGSILQPNGVAESGSFWHIAQGTPLLESSRQPRPGSLLPQISSQGLPTSGIQSPKAVVGEDENRCTAPSSYHLKDEDDFPPLSN